MGSLQITYGTTVHLPDGKLLDHLVVHIPQALMHTKASSYEHWKDLHLPEKIQEQMRTGGRENVRDGSDENVIADITAG